MLKRGKKQTARNPGLRGRAVIFLQVMPGADTTRACHQAAAAAILQQGHPLEIGHEAPLGLVVGVTHVIPDRRAFSANFAHSRHGLTPLPEFIFWTKQKNSISGSPEFPRC